MRVTFRVAKITWPKIGQLVKKRETNFLFFALRRPSIDAIVCSGSIAADPLRDHWRNA
jgi:hypothetical protein